MACNSNTTKLKASIGDTMQWLQEGDATNWLVFSVEVRGKRFFFFLYLPQALRATMGLV